MEKQEFLKRYLTDRRGTYCSKWDGLEEKFGESDLVGMWIADMEFQTCDGITEALMERVKHGIYGYSFVPEDYYRVFSDWMERRYHLPIPREWVRFSTGCVTGIAWMIHAFTEPGDSCMILTPVYYPFHNVVTNNHRNLVTVPLDYDGHGYFTMNYEAIEAAIVEHQVKMLIQCSPHNPAGRVWTEEELDRVLSICEKHHVLVVSDEIHQDLVIGDHPFVPAAAVSGGRYRDMVVTLNSASKTFNLATLIHSHILISNEELRKTYDAFAAGLNRTEVSLMGMLAAKAGYETGEDWLEGLLAVVKDNYAYVKETLNRELPRLTVCAMEGTYLALLDLRAYVDPEQVEEFVQGRCRLGVDYGEWFGAEYRGFIRVNLATDPAYVEQAVNHLIQGVKALKTI
ncbi:aminotransferase [Lachnoclostridium sp. An14]|uniref:MalY/PatB family protein n=1 Tax=Lachnoclostridium sp. An14 TaxID=1965562 RepID=UPI000B37994D|nr:MalY/PatB family protein [Lachnoclostridium sp. An14]OUQ17632.1 aminotransferase [Lachnoclostridium sp. An14]